MSRSRLKILFAANPEIAIPALRAVAETFEVVGVLTNPDRPSGRGRNLVPPPIKEEALNLNLQVIQAEKLTKAVREEVALLGVNFLISFACGHYFGPKFLDLFSEGSVNIHPSLLPKYRGSAPIQFAILEGDRETGISIQRIAAEIDSGNILSSVVFELDGTETTASLSDKVAHMVPSLLIETLDNLTQGRIEEVVQEHEKATFTRLLTKEDGVIDWSEGCQTIDSKIRAFIPWPRATTTFEGVPLAITGVTGYRLDSEVNHLEPGRVVALVKKRGLEVVCGDGVIYLSRLHMAQKREMESSAFVNGNPQIIGTILGS
ncbi:MAG: methionyl-tRNA formyltransferase [Spirochaetales bacterium]|nr:methionyl-tRNA formyltransferase [Spirochaetales bacterium]